MKQSTKTLALMVLLAAGSASAATPTVDPNKGTNAGTLITNVAEATFDIPNVDGSTTPRTSTSNTVTTTVAAKQAFNITYAQGGDTDATDNVLGAAVVKADVVPGQWVAFEYVAVNNGNAKQTITLTSDADMVVASTIKYYTPTGTFSVDPKTGAVTNGMLIPATGFDVLPAGDDPSTPAPENNSGMQTFWMVYQVPSIAPNTSAGATPIGTAQVWDSATNSNVSATEQKDPAAPAYDDLWWQYNKVTTTTPKLTTTPPPAPTPDPSGPGTPSNPGTVVVPPTKPGSPVGSAYPGNGTPTDPVDPGDAPTDPNMPTSTGYKNGTTVIAIGSNEQSAYPVGGVTQITFTNVVMNTGSLSDTVTLIPPTGLPTGVTLSFGGTDADPSTAGFQLVVAKDQTVAYTVVVTFPSTPNATTALSPISLTIGVDSGNDNNTTADSTTKDTVYPPAFLFGDSNGAAFGATLTPVITEDVIPGTNTTTNTLTNTTDNVAVFPMNLENTGTYNDSYTLSATTTVSGGTVKYYDGAGTLLSTDASGNYISPVVGAGTEATVYAVVIVPDGTAFGTYTITQTVTANYSGITFTDAAATNDKIRVTAVGSLVVGKFTQANGTVTAGTEYVSGNPGVYSTTKPSVPYVTNPTDYTATTTAAAYPSYAPGMSYSYKIIAKNTYNADITKFTISDTTPTNTKFESASVNVTGAKLLYTYGTTTNSAVAPAAGTENVTVAVDLNGDGAITAADVLTAGSQVELTLTVSVK